MGSVKHIAIAKDGTEAINAWRKENPNQQFDISDADLTGGKNLKKANFDGAILYGTRFNGAFLIGASFVGAKGWEKSEESGKPDRVVVFIGATMTEANLTDAEFVGAKLTGAIIDHAKLQRINLLGANLENSDLSNSNLNGASLAESKLGHADLRGASLMDVTVSHDTSMAGAKVAGCRIERYTLESMDKRGGLSDAQRMTMEIEDGLATLRSTYSGYLQWIHLAAVAVFLFPYVWFVLVQWVTTSLAAVDTAQSISLFKALCQFIWSGGRSWGTGWHFNFWLFLLFLYGLGYNGLRFRLLVKTKDLELEQEARGLPVRFSLTGRSLIMFKVVKAGFFLNLFVVGVHTVYFLQQPIQIPPNRVSAKQTVAQPTDEHTTRPIQWLGEHLDAESIRGLASDVGHRADMQDSVLGSNPVGDKANPAATPDDPK